jgi:hypothetical protein
MEIPENASRRSLSPAQINIFIKWKADGLLEN